VFAAAAAGAAYATTRQGRQVIQASQLPELEVQVIAEPPEGYLSLVIVNGGQGLARGTTFAVHALGSARNGVLLDGFVRPGQQIKVYTDIGPLPMDKLRGDVPDLGAMVSYRDAVGFVHYRTHDGRETIPKTWLRRRPKPAENVAMFKRLFPKFDVDGASRAKLTGMRTIPPS